MKCNKRGEFDSVNHVVNSVEFLAKYSWIYDFKVTNILSDKVLEEIPVEWFKFLKSLTVQQFNEIFFSEESQAESNLPEEVLQFIESLKMLEAPFQKCPLSPNRLTNSQKRGISLKKEHEIVNFADFIEEKCSKSDMNNVIDIGSGLGYLGEELTRRGLKVLGVEGSEGHTARAEKRKDARDSHSFETVHLKIDGTQGCIDKINNLAEDRSCLVGLHCCGDLSPNLLDVFSHCDRVSSLMLVSCCYHKMSPSPHKSGFDRFPLSSQVESAVHNSGKTYVFNGFMLRLGAQETTKRWLAMGLEEHTKHMNNVGFRALLERVANENGVQLKKKKRKGILQSDFDNIHDFTNSLSERYEIVGETKCDNFSDHVLLCYQENSHYFHLFEILTGLQFVLQSIIENLIHLDRLLYLQSSSDLSECDIFEIFDDLLSPRNKVIYVIK